MGIEWGEGGDDLPTQGRGELFYVLRTDKLYWKNCLKRKGGRKGTVVVKPLLSSFSNSVHLTFVGRK